MYRKMSKTIQTVKKASLQELMKNYTSPYFISKISNKRKYELLKLNNEMNGLVDRLSKKGKFMEFSKLFGCFTKYFECVIDNEKSMTRQFYLIVNNYSTMLLKNDVEYKKLSLLVTLLLKIRKLAKKQENIQYIGMLSNLITEVYLRMGIGSKALKAIKMSISYFNKNFNFNQKKNTENVKQLNKIYMSNLMYEINCMKVLNKPKAKIHILIEEAEDFCHYHLSDKKWFMNWSVQLRNDLELSKITKEQQKPRRCRVVKRYRAGSAANRYSIKSYTISRKRLNRSEGVNQKSQKNNTKKVQSKKLSSRNIQSSKTKINPHAIKNYLFYKRHQQLSLTMGQSHMEFSRNSYIKDMQIYDYLKNKYGKEDKRFTKNLFNINKNKKSSFKYKSSKVVSCKKFTPKKVSKEKLENDNVKTLALNPKENRDIVTIVKQIVTEEMDTLKNFVENVQNRNKQKSCSDHKRCNKENEQKEVVMCVKCTHQEEESELSLQENTVHTKKSLRKINNPTAQKTAVFESQKELEKTKKSPKYNILINNEQLSNVKSQSISSELSFTTERSLLFEADKQKKLDVSSLNDNNMLLTDVKPVQSISNIRKSFTECNNVLTNDKIENIKKDSPVVSKIKAVSKVNSWNLKNEHTESSDDQLSYMFVENVGSMKNDDEQPNEEVKKKSQFDLELNKDMLLSERKSKFIIKPALEKKDSENTFFSSICDKTNIFHIIKERISLKEFSMEREIVRVMQFDDKVFKVVIINNLISMNSLYINAYYDERFVSSVNLNLEALKFLFRKASYSDFIPFYYRHSGNDKKIEEIIANIIFQLISITVEVPKRDSIAVSHFDILNVNSNDRLIKEKELKQNQSKFVPMRQSKMMSVLSINMKSVSQRSHKSFKQFKADHYHFRINISPIPTSLLPDIEVNLFGENYLLILTHMHGLYFKIYLMSLKNNKEIGNFKYIDVFFKHSDFNDYFKQVKVENVVSVLLPESSYESSVTVIPEKKNALLNKLLNIMQSIFHKSKKTFDTSQFYNYLKIDNIKAGKYSFFKVFINKNDLRSFSLVTMSNEKEDALLSDLNINIFERIYKNISKLTLNDIQFFKLFASRHFNIKKCNKLDKSQFGQSLVDGIHLKKPKTITSMTMNMGSNSKITIFLHLYWLDSCFIFVKIDFKNSLNMDTKSLIVLLSDFLDSYDKEKSLDLKDREQLISKMNSVNWTQYLLSILEIEQDDIRLKYETIFYVL